jgi:hypothetical protein
MTNPTKNEKPFRSYWHHIFGRSFVKAFLGSDLDLANRQTSSTLIALMIIGTMCWLALFVPEIRGDIIKTLSGVIFVIIGFYFGKPPALPSSEDEDDKFESKTTP